MSRSLDALLAPSRLAVWGASATDASKLGNVLLRNAQTDPAIEVTAVHRTAAEIDGVPARSEPGAIDLALISLPAPAVESAVAQAASAGAGAAIVLASGFGEAGPDGVARERRLLDIAGEASMLLVGPNCMGVVSRTESAWLNATYFWSVPLVPGPLGFVSQSGAFGGVFFGQLRSRGLGMSRFVSVGNSADVNETDVIEWLADDDETEVIGVFCEALGGGRRFVDVVRAATQRKPVIVLKSGKAATGARAAAGHTGALTSDHLVVQAALRRAGAIEAATTDEFFDLLHAASSPASRAPSADRVAVITVSGGPSVLAADEVDRTGARLPVSSGALVAALEPLLPDFAAVANPFDLTPQCPPTSFGPAVAAIYASGEYDRVVVINCGIDSAPMADAVLAAREAHPLPTTAFLLDTPGMSERFAGAGIAVLGTAEAAVRAHRLGLERGRTA
ncbi:MAG: CoA-binding protein [Actinomycetota bacterium]